MQRRVALRRVAKWVRKACFAAVQGRLDIRRLQPADIVLWDQQGSESFASLAQVGTAAVMCTRQESYNVNWRTLLSVVSASRRGVAWQLAYRAGYICTIRPKVVVTFIDNDSNFHHLANALQEVTFIAVQNGWRWPRHEDVALPMAVGKYASQMLVFGQNDVDSWIENGYSFAALHVAGSLRNALFAKSSNGLVASNSAYRGDICLVSQYRRDLAEQREQGETWTEFEHLVEAVSSLMLEHPDFKVVVALMNGADQDDFRYEQEYFRRKMPAWTELVARSAESMSSYELADLSQMVVSSSSTLGVESLGRGKRVLLTSARLRRHLSGRGLGDVVWVPNSSDNESLSCAVLRVLRMSDEHFSARSRSTISYFIADLAERNAELILESVVRREIADRSRVLGPG